MVRQCLPTTQRKFAESYCFGAAAAVAMYFV